MHIVQFSTISRELVVAVQMDLILVILKKRTEHWIIHYLMIWNGWMWKERLKVHWLLAKWHLHPQSEHQ